MIVETTLAVRLDAPAGQALRAAAAWFEEFLGQPVTLQTRPAGAIVRAL